MELEIIDTGRNQHRNPEDITGNLFIDTLMQQYEKFQTHNKFLVVLTSGFEEIGESNSEDGLFSAYSGYQRYFAAQEIYHESISKGEKPLIILSGGKRKIGDIDYAPTLSEMMEKELIRYHNIPELDIFKEELSIDTMENAKYVLGILSMFNIENITLITGENHLPRALYIFKKTNPKINIEGISAESIIQKSYPIDIQKQRREKDHILDKQRELILNMIYRLPGGIGISLINWLANKNRNIHRK